MVEDSESYYVLRGLGEYGAVHIAIVLAKDISKAIEIANRNQTIKNDKVKWYEVKSLYLDRGFLFHTGYYSE